MDQAQVERLQDWRPYVCSSAAHTQQAQEET